jgi:hypothetical protein
MPWFGEGRRHSECDQDQDDRADDPCQRGDGQHGDHEHDERSGAHQLRTSKTWTGFAFGRAVVAWLGRAFERYHWNQQANMEPR